jgi:siroheme synthase (precorrin-2 oxidase/ferrochelatase)
VAKNKYAKLRVTISIECGGKSNKPAQKLKAKFEKLLQKKGISVHSISVDRLDSTRFNSNEHSLQRTLPQTLRTAAN